MAHYTIMQVSVVCIFFVFFISGLVFGGMSGIILGIVDRNTVGILGGMFIGLLLGTLLGFFGVTAAAMFNFLAPYFGGIKIELQADEEEKEKAAGQNDQAT